MNQNATLMYHLGQMHAMFQNTPILAINVAEQSSVAAPGMYEGAKNLVVVDLILDSNMGRRAKNFEMKFVLDLNSGAVNIVIFMKPGLLEASELLL